MKNSAIQILSILIALALVIDAPAIQVDGILANLMETKNLPGTTVTVNGGTPEFNLAGNTSRFYSFTSGDGFTFNETNMNDPTPGDMVPRQNRHEFRFSADGGATALTLDNDLPWTVDLDISITTTFANPRKAFTFTLFNSATTGGSSQVNLTTSRSPTAFAGSNLPPGESTVFGGAFDLQRVIGPCDSVAGCNPPSNPFDVDLNSSVGYATGSTIHMSMEHIPSPDGGTTPAQFIYEYDDGSPGGPYTNQRVDLRATAGGQFLNNYEMGFVILGFAYDAFGTDSYTVEISNFNVNLGLQTGDFDSDGDVDGNDFLAWQRGFGIGTTRAQGDGNGDGVVNNADLLLWQAQYGAVGPLTAITSVPEPELGLTCCLALSGFFFTYRRKLR